MSYKTALLGAAAVCLVLPGAAQDSDSGENRLEAITVEGSRLNQTEAEIGSSVSIITAEDLKTSRVFTMGIPDGQAEAGA